MVLVNPQKQVSEDGVALIDDAVAVAAIFRLVEDGQRQKPFG
ncbi:MAG: hypothetical protein ABSE92_06205 [Terriglobales bacterium]